MSLLWFYFIFAERLTTWYGNTPSEMAVFWETIRQHFAPLFWTMVVCNFVIPVPILAIKRFRTIAGTAIASCAIIVGMWIERFLIIVPALDRKFLSLLLGQLPAHLGGRHAHGLELWHDGAALPAIHEICAHDFRLGDEGWTPAAWRRNCDDALCQGRSFMAWCWKGHCPRMCRNESPLCTLRRPGDCAARRRSLGAASPELKFDPKQIVIVSGEPHEGYDFADSHLTNLPYRWAVLGAAIGGISGYLLTTLTQKAYPIVTGGMPITSGVDQRDHHLRNDDAWGHADDADRLAPRRAPAEFQGSDYRP